MTREEGIHKLRIVKKTECIGCSHRDNGEYCEKVCGIPEALGMAIEALETQAEMEEHLESAYAHGYTEAEAHFYKMRQWIPCSERLPEDSEEYLVTVKWNGINVVDIDQHFSYGWDDCGEDVIAWAKLPEPYSDTVRK